jgi:hypothetical protein
MEIIYGVTFYSRNTCEGWRLKFMIFEYHTWNQTFLNHMVQMYGVCMNTKVQCLIKWIYWRITTVTLYYLKQIVVGSESAKQTSASWNIINSLFTEI